MIEIQSLSKIFDKNAVLKGINLTIAEGRLAALVGESGCGKTVLLKHLNALMQPTTGSIAINGMALSHRYGSDLRSIRRSIGMVFQNSALFDFMTVIENLAMAAHWSFPLSMRQQEEIYRTLTRVGLKNIGHLYPSALSGGMKKRVAIARALMMQPAILLYDEPTTGLDPRRANAIMDLIETINREDGVTSLIVTHNLSRIALFDEIIMLHKGRVYFKGHPYAFIEAEDAVIQGYLGRSALSLIQHSEKSIQDELRKQKNLPTRYSIEKEATHERF